MRVGITGGRTFTVRKAVYSALDKLLARCPPWKDLEIIEGEAKGADILSRDWARERGIPYTPYYADWKKHGKAAGPIRNKQMLDSGLDFLVRFPGGHGTANMQSICEKAGVKVWQPYLNKAQLSWHITREMVRNNPDCIFVFGDNVAGKGLGGQAKEMRGEPNAVGIVTKWRPALDKLSFFRDEDYDTIKPLISECIDIIDDFYASGKTIVFPADGVGTGLADMRTYCPKLQEYLIERLKPYYENR